jgi:hypothetical protein
VDDTFGFVSENIHLGHSIWAQGWYGGWYGVWYRGLGAGATVVVSGVGLMMWGIIRILFWE